MPQQSDLNQSLFDDLNSLARDTPWLHGAAAGYATYGVVLFGALILLAIWRARHAGNGPLAAAIWSGVATVLAVGINQPLGALVAEHRPYDGKPSVLVLVGRTTDWSFPSDHSVMAGACAVVLLIANRRLGIIASIAAGLLAVTRVYVGAHYPLDVVVGLFVGGLVAITGWLVLSRPLTTAVGRLRQLAPVALWGEARAEH